MTIHWLDLALGAGLGILVGILGTWQISPRLRKWSERRELFREYHALAGRYENHRLTGDGACEPTGETVELVWQQTPSILEATGFQPNGFSAWHSYITMSLQFRGTGIGHYNNVDSIHGGTQQVVYSRQARAFTVMGLTNARKPFAHYWKLKQ